MTKKLRPGDIYTHMYLGAVPMLDDKGRVLPYLFEARKRGVIFDVGHGGGSFLLRQAVPAMKQGFIPDSISTDLHIGSMNAGMKDMLNVMSKFLIMGMPLDEVMLRSTWHPAREIKQGRARQSLGRRARRRGGAAAGEGRLRLRGHVRRADEGDAKADRRADGARRHGGLGPERHFPRGLGQAGSALHVAGRQALGWDFERDGADTQEVDQ